MNLIPRVASFFCFAWLLAYLVLGATRFAFDWFRSLGSLALDDSIAGAPTVTLIIPVLLSATLCSLLLLRYPTAGQNRSHLIPHQLSLWLCRSRKGFGEIRYGSFFATFIFLPLLIYIASSVARHLSETESESMTLENTIMIIGNAFAFGALLAMNLLFIPVARHGSILKMLGWSPAAAVRLHIWLAYFIIVAIALHGGLHMLRWKIMGERLVGMVLPPTPCWKWHDTGYQPTCHDSRLDCSCYHHFRNLTGLLGGGCALVLALIGSSLVRQRMYAVFYKAHIIVGPALVIITILHWDRSIFYFAGGLLYYMASSFPVMLESRQVCNNEAALTVALAHVLSEALGGDQSVFISITFEVSGSALLRYRAGEYVRILVPEISSVWHPFTINLVPGKENCLRIMVRAVGPFTRQLASRFSAPDPSTMPQLCIDGFHGSPNRVSQLLRHDVSVLIAGGIGITPYLSLIHMVYHAVTMNGDRSWPIQIILHWICRESCLIEYVKTEYFLPFLDECKAEGGFQLKIVIHQTRRHSDAPKLDPAIPLNSAGSSEVVKYGSFLKALHEGSPWRPSKYASGSKSTYQGNICSFASFVSIAWPGLTLIWVFYSNVVKGNEILARFALVCALMALCWGLAVISAFITSYFADDELGSGQPSWKPISGCVDECSDVELAISAVRNEAQASGFSGRTVEVRTTTDVVIEQREGRPSIPDIMDLFADATSPAIFACGPESLMRSVRQAADQQSALRGCCGKARPIAVYEECFPM